MARAKKTPQKKTQKRGSYTRCATAGCRKKARVDSVFCDNCYVASFPIEGVQRVTEIEALTFSALDTEIRNHIQGVRILDLEMTQEQQKFTLQQKDRAARRENLLAAVAAKKDEYSTFVKDLAKRYDLDPEKMTIDPDTRAIRDMRNEATHTAAT